MKAEVYIELRSDNPTISVIYEDFTPYVITEKLDGVKFSFWGRDDDGIWINNDDISSISFEQIKEDNDNEKSV